MFRNLTKNKIIGQVCRFFFVLSALIINTGLSPSKTSNISTPAPSQTIDPAQSKELDNIFKQRQINTEQKIEEISEDYEFVEKLGTDEDKSFSKPLKICMIFPSNASVAKSLKTAQKIATISSLAHQNKKFLSFLFFDSGESGSEFRSASMQAIHGKCDAVITTSTCDLGSCEHLFANSIPVFSLNHFQEKLANKLAGMPIFFALTDAADDYIPALKHIAKSQKRLDILFIIDSTPENAQSAIILNQKIPPTITYYNEKLGQNVIVPVRISGIVHKPPSDKMQDFFKREIARSSCKTYLVAKDGTLYQSSYRKSKSTNQDQAESENDPQETTRVCANVVAIISNNTPGIFGTINMLRASSSVADNAIMIGSPTMDPTKITHNLSSVGMIVPFYFGNNMTGFNYKFESMFDIKPRPIGPILYDIIEAIIDTHFSLNLDPKEISSIKGFGGITGTFGFGLGGRMLRQYSVQSLSFRGFLPLQTYSSLDQKNTNTPQASEIPNA